MSNILTIIPKIEKEKEEEKKFKRVVLTDSYRPRNKKIRVMDLNNISSITGRAFFQLKAYDNSGYSHGDCHRKHIRERYQQLAIIGNTKGGLLPCDKCGYPIHLRTLFFIHKRKAYNKYYHQDCAKRMNLY